MYTMWVYDPYQLDMISDRHYDISINFDLTVGLTKFKNYEELCSGVNLKE